MYLKFLLVRSMKPGRSCRSAFNSSEKRLARILLLMAEFDEPGKPEHLLPPITQETLAEMIGTTRSRVSFFMNRFRRLGLIEYNGRIRVLKALLMWCCTMNSPSVTRAARWFGHSRVRSKPAARASASSGSPVF